MMKKGLRYLSYPLSVIFYVLFGLALLIFHPVQWISYTVFGYQAHKKSVDVLNWVLLRCLNVLGTRFTVRNESNPPSEVPIVIVANHQSMWDVPPLIWYLRKHHPKFVSKKALGKGIPSISYNLRRGGSVLIDRKDGEQALKEIKNFATYLERFKRAGVIFPEGSRSNTHVPGVFRKSGLRMLLENMPNAYVLPVTINNSWKLQKNGMFPLPLGVSVELIIHKELKTEAHALEPLIDKIENTITAKIQDL